MQKRKPCGQSVDGQAREHLQASEGLGLESLPDEIAKLQPKDGCFARVALTLEWPSVNILDENTFEVPVAATGRCPSHPHPLLYLCTSEDDVYVVIIPWHGAVPVRDQDIFLGCTDILRGAQPLEENPFATIRLYNLDVRRSVHQSPIENAATFGMASESLHAFEFSSLSVSSGRVMPGKLQKSGLQGELFIARRPFAVCLWQKEMDETWLCIEMITDPCNAEHLRVNLQVSLATQRSLQIVATMAAFLRRSDRASSLLGCSVKLRGMLPSRLAPHLRRSAGRLAAFGTVPGREPLLFTPGPLTVSGPVKQAMLVDYGSRDKLFLDAVEEVRHQLLSIAGVSQADGYECVIVQGSGTTAVEAMLGAAVPRKDGKVLIVTNGAYGHRQKAMCQYLGIDHETLDFEDHDAICVKRVLAALREDEDFTDVSFVHHETTAGVLNPIYELVKNIKAEFPKMRVLVDSMSGFGAYPLDMSWGIDFAVSSANKCIEGVPGFGYVLCSREALQQTKGNARSLSLDIYEQWAFMESTKQFRYTPPTHAILAFQQALREFLQEGAREQRAARYQANYEVMERGMEEMGFEFYVPKAHRSYCICTFKTPSHPNFDFQTFYNLLAEQGFVIYPGKLSKGNSFRI
ncbi:phnW, partial [Symbiodinium sp. KB8]